MSDTAIYRALMSGAGFFDQSSRERLEVSGPDRAKFLHNVTTNDVKKLKPGQGQEAFVTSLQGKTLGFVGLLAGDDKMLLEMDPESLAPLLPHLQKYAVFDDVALEDVSKTTYEFHLCGPKAEAILGEAGAEVPPAGEWNHRETQIAGRTVRVARRSPTGLPGFSLIGPIGEGPEISAKLHEAGAGSGLVDIPSELYEALRIEAGTPVFGRDLSTDNLPQELGRDNQAISFVKGCYLGQETVARIDALGHVNKCLKGFEFPSESVPVEMGAEINIDGKRVGTVTSSALSPSKGRPIALGYIRATQSQAGTEVNVATSSATVSAIVRDLPMEKALAS